MFALTVNINFSNIALLLSKWLEKEGKCYNSESHTGMMIFELLVEEKQARFFSFQLKTARLKNFKRLLLIKNFLKGVCHEIFDLQFFS